MTNEQKEHIYGNMGKLIKEYLRHLHNGDDLNDILLDNLLQIQSELNQIAVDKIIQVQNI